MRYKTKAPEHHDFLPLLLLKLERQIKRLEVGGTFGHNVETSNISLRLRKDYIITFPVNAASHGHTYAGARYDTLAQHSVPKTIWH